MNSEAPVNAGHNFANAAEDFEENEQWLKAAEAHSKAAEQFQIALKDTQDAEALKTLRLLTANHTRKAADLNRKAQRLINSAANQRMHQMVGGGSNLRSAGVNNGLNSGGGLRHALPESNRQPRNAGLLVSRLAGKQDIPIDEASHHRTSEIGESYALLTSDDNDDDPFNKFLEAVEGLVQQLFNPAVAFTSAPLNENDNPIPIINIPIESSPPAIESKPDETKKSTVINTTKASNMIESYYMVPSPDGSDDPSNYQNIVSKTQSISLGTKPNKSAEQQLQENYKAENENFRAQITQLQNQMKKLQMSAEEGNMLKSSVLQFRNDVHKQAKRIMQSHHESSMRSSAAALLGPGGGGSGGTNSIMGNSIRYPALAGGSGGHDLASRLKELEAENKQLRAQNEKQNLLVNRYRERWEMLKENAKKRRTPSTVSTPITEEIEN